MPKPPDRSRAGVLAPTVPLEQSFLSLRSDIDRVIEDFVSRLAPPMRIRGAGFGPFGRVEMEIGAGSTILPVADMVETAADVIVTMELPGLDQTDLEVSLEDDTLVVSGVKDEGNLDEGDRLLMRERRFGTFRRAFRLPAGIDTEKLSASFDNGLLTVVMPKSATPAGEPKRVAVKPRS